MFESRNRLLLAALAAALGDHRAGRLLRHQRRRTVPAAADRGLQGAISTRRRVACRTRSTCSSRRARPDGTLNLPARLPWRAAAMREALNALDGWSTTAPITTRLQHAARPGVARRRPRCKSSSCTSSNTTKAAGRRAPSLPAGVTSPVRRVLVSGTDYTAEVATTSTAAARPQDHAAQAAHAELPDAQSNIGYLVILTNGIQAHDGQPARRDRPLRRVQDRAGRLQHLHGCDPERGSAN